MKKLLICVVLLAAVQLFAGIQDVKTKYNVKNYQGAIEEAKKVIADPQSSIHDKAESQYYIGLSYDDMHDHKTALAEYNKVIDVYPSEKSVHYNALQGIFTTNFALEDWKQALDTINKMIADYPNTGYANMLRAQIPYCYYYMKDYDKALAYLKNTEQLYTICPLASGTSQILIARWSIQADKDDVLLQTKLYFDVSLLGDAQSAIDMVCQAFKNADLNLKRVNQFLKYQEDGSGTNPLADIKVPADRVAFLEGLTAKCANDYDGVRNQTYIYLMAGEPQKAISKAKKAFGLAQMKDLNQAVMDIAVCLKAMDGNIIRANKYIEAQKKGEDFPLP